MAVSRRRRRIVAGGCVLGAMLTAFFACVRDDLVACGDQLCPATLVCTPGGCAAPEAAAACAGLPDGMPCAIVAIPAGTCHAGACTANVCGDGIREMGEACDDGNTADGDACSADCRSTLVCGNGTIDLSTGEQCDSGIPGLSGDGCSSHCDIEIPVWREVTFPAFGGRAYAALAPDANGSLLLIGGTGGSDASVNAPLVPHVQIDGVTVHAHAGWIADPTAAGTVTKIPMLSNAAMAYDADRHRTVLFGGIDADGAIRAKTWEWDGHIWRDRSPAASPSPRYDAALDYDPVAHRVVLFGGTGGGSAYLSDTWTWDGAAGAWSEEPYQGSDHVPVGRHRAVLAYDPNAHQHVLFGGLSFNGGITDTWTLVLGGAGWTEVTTGAHPPAPTDSAGNAMAFSPTENRTVVVGEAGSSWSFNGSDWAQDIGSGGTTPSLTGFATYDPNTNRAFLVKSSQLFQRGTGGWQNIALAVRPTQPSGAVYDAHGGRGLITSVQGTWLWDGAYLAKATAVTAPGAMTYDTARHEVVSFGGTTFVAWDGTAWTAKAAAALPSSRGSVALASDEAHERVVMFGGSPSLPSTPMNETWLWDGTTWTQATTATAPPPRTSASMAYDRKRGVVVLFGGEDAAFHPLGDTWEWDGATWTQRTPAAAPPARWSGVLAYDPRWQRLVLLGGQAGNTANQLDTWTYDGTTWTKLATFTDLGANVANIGFIDGHGDLVTIGPQSVWRLRYESPVTPSERCTFATDDADGDGLAGCADPDCWSRCSPACPPNSTCAPGAARCGDGACDALEDYLLCPADCPAPAN